MKKRFLFKTGLISLTSLLLAVSAGAVDNAEVATDVGSIYSASVSAKMRLSDAAKSGDAAQVAEASKIDAAVDAAVAKAQAAVSAIDGATSSDVAEAALVDLKNALQEAQNALAGVFVNDAEKDKGNGGVKGKGGGQNPPNIYDTPWQSELHRSAMEGLFGNFWGTSAFGTRKGFGDREATPE